MAAHFSIYNSSKKISPISGCMRRIKTLVKSPMDNPQAILLIVIALFWLLIGVAGSNLAKKKHRNQGLWFINCILSGLFSLLVVACSSTLEYDEEIDGKETDTLGCIIFIISLVMFGLSIWYGYLEAEAYHERLFWDSYFMMMR